MQQSACHNWRHMWNCQLLSLYMCTIRHDPVIACLHTASRLACISTVCVCVCVCPGEASLAASLNFVPAQLPTTPAFRGLQVDLAIRNLNATTRQPTGPLLSVAPLGATLHVLVQVATPDDLQETTVRVLLPGGLEPIDRNLDEFGNTAVCPLPFFLSFFTSSGSRSRFGFASFFWFPTCPRVETTPESVTFFLDRLSPGTHEYSFLAIAASPGPPTRRPAVCLFGSTRIGAEFRFRLFTLLR